MKVEIFGRMKLGYINGRIWELDNCGGFFSVNAGGLWIVPEHGFITDFASIPRVFWRILPPVGDGSRARYGVIAVIHDYLYAMHRPTIDGPEITKDWSDRVFRDGMTALDVEPWKKNVMYQAVNWCGGSSWKQGPGRQPKLKAEAAKYIV